MKVMAPTGGGDRRGDDRQPQPHRVHVRSTFSKNGGNLGETGSVGFMFERKGQVTYPAIVGDEDAVMMAAIEAGAEDAKAATTGT